MSSTPSVPPHPSSGTPPAPAAAAPPPTPQRSCLNTFCKEPAAKADGRRRGWRLRCGESAELCERCLCIYEQGTFCETFHNEVAGWRNCEACRKRVHCGCIVSAHAYILLDIGGVECISCAHKFVGTIPSPWVKPAQIHPNHNQNHARLQNMRHPSSPFPGHWRQASSSLWNISSAQSDLQQRLAFEFDRPSCSEKFMHQVRASNPIHQHHADKKFDEMPSPIMRDRFVNGPTAPPGLDPAHPYSIYHRAEGTSSSSPNPNSNNVNQIITSDLTGMDHAPVFNRGEEPIRFGPGIVSGSSSPSKGQGFFGPSQLEGSEMRSNGGRLDGRNRSQQLLSRYRPRITRQELQQINGDNNSSTSVITPLFEKMLSASDAGRIGRLVLPKKCAETYFPQIEVPEGLPLKVQDSNGKNWTFQFRFWPNNNSRMYVLEGITPCIQAMQLQAGDTVTFSRIDPEGKLVMGFRKAAPAIGEPEVQHLKSGNGFMTSPIPDIATAPKPSPVDQQEPTNPNPNPNPIQPDWSMKDTVQAGPSLFPMRRKNNANISGRKIKRLRIENEDSMELKVTWEEAQSLIRPAPNSVPTFEVTDGIEFEEYKEEPVLGRRTYLITNLSGETHQWAQCCECMKWRKIPTDALLTANWTCSENIWDSERSLCSSPAELTLEQLVELMPTRAGGGTKRKLKMEAPDMCIEPLDGLDTLANLALEQSESCMPGSSVVNPTTRHPRHRPGCSCIVCIQPPSGKGPKHKSTCVCSVCITVRRRFRTLMMRKERKGVVTEKDLEESANHASPPGDCFMADDVKTVTGLLVPVADDVKNASSSPLKAKIDLNIQPEKEEETSPKPVVDELAATSAVKILEQDDTPLPGPGTGTGPGSAES